MMQSQCKRNKITTPFGKEAYDEIDRDDSTVVIQRGPTKYDKPEAERGSSRTSHDQTVAIILVGNNNIIGIPLFEPKMPNNGVWFISIVKWRSHKYYRNRMIDRASHSTCE